MIKRNNKKGFTIVELVIVIAVIAILAAVLIPTFAGIIKKANLSADQQAVRNMNVALAASGDLEGIDAAVDALSENGFNAADTLVPVSKGYAFYWFETANTVLLVEMNEDETPKAVVYPDDETLAADFMAASDDVRHNLKGAVKYLNAEVKDADGFAEAFANGQLDIKLEADMTINSATTVLPDAEVVVDLGGKTLTTGERDTNGSHFYAFDVKGTVTFTNGTIDARGVQIYDGGKIVIGEGATINAVDNDGGACIWLYAGSELVIDGGTFNALKGDCDDANDAAGKKEPGIINNNGGTITIKGGTFKSQSNCQAIINNSGSITIEGGTFEASRGVVCAMGGNVTITGGTFTVADDATSYPVYATAAATVVVEAGSLNTATNNVVAVCAPTNEGYTSAKITLKAGVVVNGEALTEDVTLDEAGEKFVSAP